MSVAVISNPLSCLTVFSTTPEVSPQAEEELMKKPPAKMFVWLFKVCFAALIKQM